MITHGWGFFLCKSTCVISCVRGNRVEEGSGWCSETQTDEDVYKNVENNLQISLEATIIEIIADVLRVKNRPEVEADSDHEEEELDKSIVTKKKALEYIDGWRNYISTLNDTTDRDYDILYSLEKKKSISENSHQAKMDVFF